MAPSTTSAMSARVDEWQQQRVVGPPVLSRTGGARLGSRALHALGALRTEHYGAVPGLAEA